MKKKMMSIAICCLIVMAMVAVGCKKNNVVATSEQGSPIYSVDDTQPVIIEDPSETPSEEPSEVVIEDPPEEEDPLALLLTDEATAQENEGLFLVRDEKFYTLAGQFLQTEGVAYDDRYVRSDNCNHLYYRGKNGKVSCGQVPIPVIQEGDSIRSYSSSDVPELWVRKVESIYYTIPICEYNDGYAVIAKNDLNIWMLPESFELSDKNGNKCENYLDLVFGEEYTLSWNEGTKYSELIYTADCTFFKYDPYGKCAYIITGDLSKEGYVEYDLSGMEPGLYCVETNNLFSGGIIEIQ